MVFILPMEFDASSDEEVEQTMAQLSLDPMQAIFEKPGDKSACDTLGVWTVELYLFYASCA